MFEPNGPIAKARSSFDAISCSTVSIHSPAIPKLLQVGCDGGVQLRGFGLLLAQRRRKPLHFLPERFAVVLGRFRADVAAGRKHMAVLADVIELRGLAEAGHVNV